jgi:hypothetical protein
MLQRKKTALPTPAPFHGSKDSKRFNALTNEQKAYFAGFLDCDGCVMSQVLFRKDYVLKYQYRCSIVFYQKTKRKHFLKKMQLEFKTGTLRDRPDGMTELGLVGQHTVLPLLHALKPFVRIKHKQVKLMIRICELLPKIKNSPTKFLEVAQLSEQIKALNDSNQKFGSKWSLVGEQIHQIEGTEP